MSVKMLEKEKVVRGVGSNKAEAIRRAFKSMELLLRDAIAINENGSQVGAREMSNDGLSDSIVNFDENLLLPSKPCGPGVYKVTFCGCPPPGPLIRVPGEIN